VTAVANDTREQGATLVALEVENVKRLKVVRIRPDGSPMVVVGGDNEQGKSSLLDSIEMLLKGGRMPDVPVHRGQTDGRIYGELSNGLVIERNFSPAGTTLTLRRGKRGKPISRPQSVLDELLDEMAFDPLEFLGKKGTEQTEIMKRAIGLDFSDLEQERDEAFEERKIVNAKIKSLKGAIEESVRYDDAPAEEVSIAELAEQLKDAHEANAARGRLVQAVNNATRVREATELRVQQLRAELAAAETALAASRDVLTEAEQDLASAAEPVDIEPLQQQLQNAEVINRKVRANQQIDAQEFDLVDLEDKTRELTERLEDIEAEKAKRLAAARFPVEGLGFGPDGPTLDGLPFDQGRFELIVEDMGP